MTTAVTFLGSDLSEKRFREALPPGSKLVTIRLNGTSAYSGLVQQYPTLIDFMAEHAPEWTPGEPLLLFAFSAGTWALRHYMNDEDARRLTTVVMVMDGLYGGVPCNLAPFNGIVDYAREANASPSTKRLIITYSLSTPAPAACTRAIEAIASGPGLIVAETHVGSHGAQLTDVGPSAAAKFITPWLGAATTTRRKKDGGVIIGGVLLLAAGYGLFRLVTR